MRPTRRWLTFLSTVGALLALAPGSGALAQSDATAPVTTDLTYSGPLNAEVTGSNTNACFIEDGELRAQLLGVGSASILSFDLSDAQAGTYPIQPGLEPLVQ